MAAKKKALEAIHGLSCQQHLEGRINELLNDYPRLEKEIIACRKHGCTKVEVISAPYGSGLLSPEVKRERKTAIIVLNSR